MERVFIPVPLICIHPRIIPPRIGVKVHDVGADAQLVFSDKLSVIPCIARPHRFAAIAGLELDVEDRLLSVDADPCDGIGALPDDNLLLGVEVFQDLAVLDTENELRDVVSVVGGDVFRHVIVVLCHLKSDTSSLRFL